MLYVFLVLSNERRRVIHFNATESPIAAWIGQQIIEAFPWDTAPRYLIRDRDKKYGDKFIRSLESMDIEQVLISARSPWQNPYVERVIGSIRRECLDHTIIFNENHLRRVLKEYFRYYHESRTHLGLEKDCPEPRPVESVDSGRVQAEPVVGGLLIATIARLLNSGCIGIKFHHWINLPRFAIIFHLTASVHYLAYKTDFFAEGLPLL